MLTWFLPQHTPNLAHSLFGSIVGVLEFFLFLIELLEFVVLCHNDLGGVVQLTSEVRDLCFNYFHVPNCFFPPLHCLRCSHGFSLPLFSPVVL